MTKIIFKTALITLASIVILLGVILGGLMLFNPLFLAERSEKLGLNDFSMQMYERNYNKDSNINNLYLLVNKSIILKDDARLVKYFPKLEAHEKYDALINALNEANFDEDEKVLTNIKLSNSDNRLKTRFVEAVAKTNFEGAFNYAIADIRDVDITSNNINFIVTGLAKYITSDNATIFTEVKYGTSASDLIQDLYNNLSDRYTTRKTSASIYENALVCDKLISVTQFMILLENKIFCGYEKDTLQTHLQTLWNEYKTYIR